MLVDPAATKAHLVHGAQLLESWKAHKGHTSGRLDSARSMRSIQWVQLDVLLTLQKGPLIYRGRVLGSQV